MLLNCDGYTHGKLSDWRADDSFRDSFADLWSREVVEQMGLDDDDANALMLVSETEFGCSHALFVIRDGSISGEAFADLTLSVAIADQRERDSIREEMRTIALHGSL